MDNRIFIGILVCVAGLVAIFVISVCVIKPLLFGSITDVNNVSFSDWVNDSDGGKTVYKLLEIKGSPLENVTFSIKDELNNDTNIYILNGFVYIKSYLPAKIIFSDESGKYIFDAEVKE